MISLEIGWYIKQQIFLKFFMCFFIKFIFRWVALQVESVDLAYTARLRML